MVDLLGDEHSNSQLDASSTAQDRRLLTSVVILPSDFRGDLCGLVIRIVEIEVVSFGLVPPQGVGGCQSLGRYVPSE